MRLQYVEVCSVFTIVSVGIWSHMLLPQIFVCAKPLFWSSCQMLKNCLLVIAQSSANGKEG